MNPFDVAFFSAPDCIPCCGAAGECICALQIPPFDAPYADYTTAETAIADQTAGCIAYYDPEGDTSNSLSASFDGTTITADAHTEIASSSALGVDTYFNVSLLSGATLSIPFTLTITGSTPVATASLLNCSTGAVVDSDTVSGASGTLSLTAPSDGEYVLLVRGEATAGTPTSTDMAFTVTCDDTYWVNPVIALWDDSGTTRKLWACPKLLLPPLTEDTGTWYADCAAADSAMSVDTRTGGGTGPYVSNCVGYMEDSPSPTPGTTVFTATDGGSSLALNVNSPTNNFGSTSPAWGGINAEAGETISIAWDWADFDMAWVIFDDTGTSIDGGTASAGTSPAVSSALPYTGRYTVKVSAFLPLGPGAETDDITFTITSSGTMSVNGIQARYDLGLTCAATLDCGDACP